MIVYRALPLDRDAPAAGPGGALWFPRALQGAGRHDNPDRYGCLYVSQEPHAAIAEQLAPFRGTGALEQSMLERFGRRLTLAALELSDDAELLDLDQPRVLVRERLRPSQVATRARTVTQAHAAALHERHAAAVGLRWWSILESSWLHVTLFDRGAPALSVEDVRALDTRDEDVLRAADALGLSHLST